MPATTKPAHVIYQRPIPTAIGVKVLLYTACGRLVKGRTHALWMQDVTCKHCRRTTLWRFYRRQEQRHQLQYR